MPRDLFSERDAAFLLDEEPQLHKSPNQMTSEESISPLPDKVTAGSAMFSSRSSSTENPVQGIKGDIKPYVQSLTMLDLESCVKLEEATFPPQERCTREKFIYRLTKCSELSIGLFTSANTSSPAPPSSSPSAADAVTASTSQPVYSGTPARKQVLLAHIIATLTTNPKVTDSDMALPPHWDDASQQQDPTLGHKQAGRTLCIHSLAVLPAFQKKGLGKLLMKSYIQRIESSAVADRVALIAHEGLVGYYEQLGFESKGKSKCQFGGGGWTDMVLELKDRKQSLVL